MWVVADGTVWGGVQIYVDTEESDCLSLAMSRNNLTENLDHFNTMILLQEYTEEKWS